MITRIVQPVVSIFILLCLSLTVTAQEKVNIQGIIKDESGTPVINASVSLNGTTVVSSEAGRFEITGVNTGKQKLVVSSIGYESKTITVYVSARPTDIEIVLTSLTSQLQTVEVTGRRTEGYKANYSFAATKIAIPVVEIPSTVSTITQSMIKDRQAVRFDEVARNTNVRVTNTGRSIIIRGFDNGTKLINGLRTLSPNYRFSSITPVVESFEVVKGPSSSMFGNMSPGGVVNIITKKPLAEKKQSLSFSAGSFNTLRSDMDFTGKLTDDGTVLYRLNVFGQLSDTWLQNMKDNALTVAPSISFLPREGTRINIDLNHTRLTTMENVGIFPFRNKPIDETPVHFTVLQAGDRNNTTTTSLNLSLSQRITKNIAFNMSYLKDNLSWEERKHDPRTFYGDRAWVSDSAVSVSYAEWETRMNSDNITGYFTADFNTGRLKHKALLGYDFNVSLFNWGTFRYNDSVGVVNVYNPAKSSTLDRSLYNLTVTNYDRANQTRDYANGIYFQDQISILAQLKLLLGLRYEKYTYRLAYKTPTENEVSQSVWLPKVGLTYHLPSDTYIYASYVTGFEPVSSRILAGGFGKLEGEGSFKAENSYQFEIGVKQELFNKNLLVTAAVYQIKKKNLTQLINPTVPNAADRLYRQLGEVTSEGVEVEANGQINQSFSLSAAYNYNHARITNDIDNAKIGVRLGLSPKHQGNVWAKYEIVNNSVLNGLGIAAGASFSSETPLLQAPAVSTPGYGVADAAIMYRINKVTFNLNINNIFDKRFYTGAVRQTERFYTGAPRNIMFRVGYTL